MTDIITLDEVKSWLGIANDDHNVVLELIRGSVCSSVDNYTETKFSQQTATDEILDSSGSDTIVTRNTPLISVASIYTSVNTDGSGGSLLDAENYYVYEDRIVLRGFLQPVGRALVKVTYDWGYASVPGDVKMAGLLSVEAIFRRKGNKSIAGGGQRSKRDESEGRSGGTDPDKIWDKKTGLPKEAVAMLNPYRNYGFPVLPIAQRNP